MISEIEKLHDCEQSHGKIVCIEADKLGNTYCGYCHKRVDYSKLHNEDFQKFKKRLIEKDMLYKETNEKFVGRVENMLYNVCGCDFKRGKIILQECIKRNKEKNDNTH